MPQWLARVNKYITNPIQRLWAGRLPAFAIIQHTGRKSGKKFRTPVSAFQTPDGVAILLTYGPDRDWLKNLQAAGGGKIVRRGKTHTVATPRVVSRDEAAALVKFRAFGRAPFEHVALLTYA